MSLVGSQPKQAAAATPKEKTKAKKRYLKAKKERRKKKKGSSTAPDAGERGQSPAGSTHSHPDSESEDEQTGQEDDENASTPDLLMVEGSRKELVQERPRKRRKLDVVVDEGPKHPIPEAASETKMDLEEEVHAGTSANRGRPRSQTPQAALPSFPLPRRPNAPSRSTLALQGLDKALIEAEIVNPTTLHPFASDGDDDGGTGLGEKARKRLSELGITELFAVQTAVVPFLLSPPRLKSLYLPYDPPRDVCVSAPTGSGKTLAYVLPIVEVLSARIVTRLRALIVLPTRDLVTQVRETFEAVAKGRGLKIGTATGQHSFAHEQTQLVAERSTSLQGGSSKIDILICTPGRLIDHLNGTPNFSLQHLRYLVVDEADRLLAQSFQDWLAQVLAATRPPSNIGDNPNTTDTDTKHSTLPRADALAPAFVGLPRYLPYIRTDLDERRESSCQKLLFSATLTRDPAKISALNLHDPKYLVVQDRERLAIEGAESTPDVLDLVMEKFSMPATLAEHMLVCESSQKPLMLFHLVHSHGITNALVFTKSAESTARLVRLLEFFETARTADPNARQESVVKRIVASAYSSDLSPAERRGILEKFKNQEIHILVCSDLISRGIDISHVTHVVSYDAPVDMRKYVHRVGRTARAGRAGDAWTLVEEQEARYFKNMLKEGGHLEKVKRMRVSDKDVSPFHAIYESALGQLKESYARFSN